MEHTENTLASVAKRTLVNLRRIESIDSDEAERGIAERERSVYPITQLVNSLLGLIVFPKERYADELPNRSLEDLVKEGWPALNITYPTEICEPEAKGCGDAACPCKKHKKPRVRPHPRCRNLKQFIRVLRNGVSHFNLEFRLDNGEVGDRSIAGIEVSNECPQCGKVTTCVVLHKDDIRDIAERYARLLIDHLGA